MLEYMAAQGIRPSDPRPAAEPEPELDPHRPGLVRSGFCTVLCRALLTRIPVAAGYHAHQR